MGRDRHDGKAYAHSALMFARGIREAGRARPCRFPLRRGRFIEDMIELNQVLVQCTFVANDFLSLRAGPEVPRRNLVAFSTAFGFVFCAAFRAYNTVTGGNVRQRQARVLNTICGSALHSSVISTCFAQLAAPQNPVENASASECHSANGADSNERQGRDRS